MAISREDVQHVARLAWLALSPEEIERFTGELDKILDAIGIVSELDLEEVLPTSHPLDLVNVWDDDVPRDSLSREDVLANAPDADAVSSGCRHGGSSRHAPADRRGGERPSRARRDLRCGAPRRVSARRSTSATASCTAT